MKRLTLLASILVLTTSACFAGKGAELTPLMVKPGKVIVEESFASNEVPPPLIARKGDWRMGDGAITGTEIKAQNHAALLMINQPFRNSIVRFSFKLDGGKLFTVALHGADGHLFRVAAGPDGLAIIKDKDAANNVALAKSSEKFTPGEWHTIQIEFQGASVAVQSDTGVKLTASDPDFDAEKVGYRFLVTGATGSMTDLKVWEAQP